MVLSIFIQGTLFNQADIIAWTLLPLRGDLLLFLQLHFVLDVPIDKPTDVHRLDPRHPDQHPHPMSAFLPRRCTTDHLTLKIRENMILYE